MTAPAVAVTRLGVGALALLMGVAVARGDGLLVLGAVLACAGIFGAVRLAESPSAALVALTFVIAALPVLRLVIGGAPLYAIDVLALLGLVALARRPVPLTHFGWLVLAYLVSWIPAWVHQMTSLHLVEEPTYGLLRNALAVSVFFVAYACATQPGFFERWSLALAAGASLTATFALLQAAHSEPVEKVLRTVAPDFTSTAYRTYPDRAFAFFAAPTILAGFFAVVLLLLLPLVGERQASFRGLTWIALVMAPLGALATYSRQWVPAVGIGLIVVSAVRLRATGRILIVTGLGVLVAWALLGGGALDRSYLEERFHRLGPTDINVQTRVARQEAFLALAREHPADFAVGKGFSGQDIVTRGLVPSETAQALREGLNDNVFFLEVFNHGIAAGMLYLGLMAAALTRILRAARSGGPHARELAGIGAALATALALHLLDNYFSEVVFMKMLLWTIVGVGLGLVDRQRRELA